MPIITLQIAIVTVIIQYRLNIVCKCIVIIGLFGVAMSPRSASHRPRHDWRALRDVSPTQG